MCMWIYTGHRTKLSSSGTTRPTDQTDHSLPLTLPLAFLPPHSPVRDTDLLHDATQVFQTLQHVVKAGNAGFTMQDQGHWSAIFLDRPSANFGAREGAVLEKLHEPDGLVDDSLRPRRTGNKFLQCGACSM